MKRIRRNVERRRTTPRLIRDALRSGDEERVSRSITELQSRGSEALLARLRILVRSVSARRRALGMSILAQLHQRRGGYWPYAIEATQELLMAGLDDSEWRVRAEAATGLGHRPHPAALPRLIRESRDPQGLLRWKVTVALGSYEEMDAADALLELAKDPDDDIRDWATFGLGTMLSFDTPAIRDRLALNLKDSDPDVQGEALVGLATRADVRALEHLRKHLNADCRVYELNAAEALRDASLAPQLEAIRDGIPEGERDSYWFRVLLSTIASLKTVDGESVA